MTAPCECRVGLGGGREGARYIIPDMDTIRLQQMLTQHDAAMGAFQRSSAAFDDAVSGLRLALEAVAAANHAQGDAIAAIMAANRLALQMSNRPEP